MGRNEKCVEKFLFFGSPYFVDVLDGFVEKNQVTLRFIELLCETTSAGNKKLDELLQSFIHLPALEELYPYVKYEIPQEILKTLRNNGVYCDL